MATRKTNIDKTDNCIIKCNPHRELTTGYTKVKVMPENYSKIVLIAGVTGKSIQDIVNELLTFAVGKTKIETNNGHIDIANIEEGI